MQQELAEAHAIKAITALIATVTVPFAPTADDLDPAGQDIIDGTLLTCGSWSAHRELYSGKHHTTGLNVQVACTMDGHLAWISDPVDGCHHDTWAMRQSGVLRGCDPINWMGDKGYIERTIANIKTWRILHTNYRHPLATFNQTINAVIGLIFWLAA